MGGHQTSTDRVVGLQPTKLLQNTDFTGHKLATQNNSLGGHRKQELQRVKIYHRAIFFIPP